NKNSQSPDLIPWLQTQDSGTKAQSTPTQQTTTGANDMPLSAGHLWQTGIGLVVVIGLILIVGLLAKRFGPYKRMGGRRLRIVAGQSLGPRERVAIVEVEDTWLVLGVTQ